MPGAPREPSSTDTPASMVAAPVSTPGRAQVPPSHCAPARDLPAWTVASPPAFSSASETVAGSAAPPGARWIASVPFSGRPGTCSPSSFASA
jgi:hypothetical protein